MKTTPSSEQYKSVSFSFFACVCVCVLYAKAMGVNRRENKMWKKRVRDRERTKDRNNERKHDENTLCLITDFFLLLRIVEVDSVPLTAGDMNY